MSSAELQWVTCKGQVHDVNLDFCLFHHLGLLACSVAYSSLHLTAVSDAVNHHSKCTFLQTTTLHFFRFLFLFYAVLMIELGYGTKTTWLGLRTRSGFRLKLPVLVANKQGRKISQIFPNQKYQFFVTTMNGDDNRSEVSAVSRFPTFKTQCSLDSETQS